MTRAELQEGAADLLIRFNRVICQWATGVGKSGVVMQFLKKRPNITCLILVPEQANIENWKAEFNKFGIPLDGVTIACYASYHKYSNTNWGLLVFDEAPHIDTEKRKKICNTVHGFFILALGAVISRDEVAVLEAIYGDFVKSYISLSKAIEMGFLGKPKVNICHIKLDNKEKKVWYQGRLYTEKEAYDIIDWQTAKAVDRFNKFKNKRNEQKMFRLGLERKQCLGSLKSTAAKRLCKHLQSQGKRFICFCSSIKQANQLGGANALTSQTPRRYHLLQQFNNYEINSLYVVGKLIEGQNLNGIEEGVIIQLSNKERITVQSIGRVMRSPNPVIWILVFDDTKDESLLYDVIHTIPEQYISHYNL